MLYWPRCRAPYCGVSISFDLERPCCGSLVLFCNYCFAKYYYQKAKLSDKYGVPYSMERIPIDIGIPGTETLTNQIGKSTGVQQAANAATVQGSKAAQTADEVPSNLNASRPSSAPPMHYVQLHAWNDQRAAYSAPSPNLHNAPLGYMAPSPYSYPPPGWPGPPGMPPPPFYTGYQQYPAYPNQVPANYGHGHMGTPTFAPLASGQPPAPPGHPHAPASDTQAAVPKNVVGAGYPGIQDWIRTSVDGNPQRADEGRGVKFAVFGDALVELGYETVKDLNNPEAFRMNDLIILLKPICKISPRHAMLLLQWAAEDVNCLEMARK